jgi:drug/metabolite transporter (DMT)-like permease
MFTASAAPPAATFAYVNALVAVLLGWLVVGEPIGPSVLLGTLIIVPAVILAVSGPCRPR